MMKKPLLLAIPFLLVLNNAFTQVASGGNTIRIYSYPMDPREHPDDKRRIVKPPDASMFGNKVQFMALRSLEGDYRSLIDKYTVKFGLGNIIWPSYPVIFRSDLSEVVQEIKQRNLYLFDIWGYVPGSGPGGYWQQFKVPRNALRLFEKELGDHWLGMDNGEQDGRYVGGFASQMTPGSACREDQYLNFQNHFQGLSDKLGNRLATLVSLNFGHYFLKEGVYTIIGAETAQGLPNTQIYYSFIRGAGKQYGVPWFGNASVWNRWGWKNYEGVSDYNGGNREGTSLSLLKRLIYNHIMYNCSAVGFESSFLNAKGELSPIGRIQQSAVQWVRKNGNPGTLYTPVAIMTDFFAGWTFPRHLYTENIYRVWGNLPYDEGDYLTDGALNILYPGYQNASYFHDETGFITPTPYGDAADCILSDCPLWLLQQYPVVVIAGKLNSDHEIKYKLEKYVQSGGHLIITSGNLENIPDGLLEVKTMPPATQVNENALVEYQNTRIKESSAFQITGLSYPDRAKTIAFYGQKPIAIECSFGKGKLTVFAAVFGIPSKPVTTIPIKSEIDKELETPYPLLNHVKAICSDIFAGTQIFQTNPELSLIICRKDHGEYTLAMSNNSWVEKPFTLVSNGGKIETIRELPIDCEEKKAIGYLPKNVKNSTGENTKGTISGGDIRIFSVKIVEKNIELIPRIYPLPNPQNRGINLGKVLSVKEEILLRPTFFQHFDRVMIDWKYLFQREDSVLSEESGWIKQQGLKVLVDLSSGINLFPDLRLVNNDSGEYVHSLKIIKCVIDKMALLGANDLIMTTHRSIENNFTPAQFKESLTKTMKELCQYSARHNINIHLRLTVARDPLTLEEAAELVSSISEPNFFVAPSLALMLSDATDREKMRDALRNLKFSILLISAYEKDIRGELWNLNLPLNKYGSKKEVIDLLQWAPGKIQMLDALYKNKDEEYEDVRFLDESIN
jgi:hypothetical protein